MTNLDRVVDGCRPQPVHGDDLSGRPKGRRLACYWYTDHGLISVVAYRSKDGFADHHRQRSRKDLYLYDVSLFRLETRQLIL